MKRGWTPPADCAMAPSGPCLATCVEAGACRARELRLTDGSTVVGQPLGTDGEALRFYAGRPDRGPRLIPFASVEPLSLHEALLCVTDPADGPGLLRLAEICARRGLVEAATREIARARVLGPEMAREAGAFEDRLREEAATRILEDLLEHRVAGREAHARASLQDLLGRFPASEAAREARRLTRFPAAVRGEGAKGPARRKRER